MKQDMKSKQIWEYFLKNESITKKENVKEEIIISWYYCKDNDVDPYSGVASKILDLSALEQKQNVLGCLSLPAFYHLLSNEFTKFIKAVGINRRWF